MVPLLDSVETTNPESISEEKRQIRMRAMLLPACLDAHAPRSPIKRVLELCEDRVRDGPASGEKGSKGRNYLDCIRGNGLRQPCYVTLQVHTLAEIPVPEFPQSQLCSVSDTDLGSITGINLRQIQGYLAHTKQPPP